MKKTEVRTRFAPSPTGFLHIGGLRTALFNYLYAQKHQGKFILRLEDTDRERYVAEGIQQIEEVLSWVGLQPDEGVWQGKHTGDVGPYVQSERLPNYAQYAEALIEQGLAYRSYISSEEFGAKRESAIKNKQPFVYRRDMEPAQGDATNVPIRVDILSVAKKLGVQAVSWHDEVRGEFTVDISTIDDLIIVKADGFPTYNFANVIDDHLMRITHILRGDEFISSTPKHALLYDALGFERPIWAHLPVILGADGSKLSKRHGDTDALQYREKGYLPEALINFLALLGWNDGTEKEIFTFTELVDAFELSRIQKSPAKFDLERLNWINGVYIREIMSEEAFESRAIDELQRADLPVGEVAKSAIRLERDRIKFFSELPRMVDFFLIPPKADSDMKQLLTAKLPAAKVADYLDQANSALQNVVSDPDLVEVALRDRAQEKEIKPGELFATIRVAISGRTQAPGLFETIATMGVEESRTRLTAARTLFD